MLKLLIFFIGNFFFSNCIGQPSLPQVLDESFYFPHASGQMSKIDLRNDSLFLSHVDAVGREESTTIYKVNRQTKPGGIEIFIGTWLQSRSGHLLPHNRIKNLVMVFKTEGHDRLVLIGSKKLDDNATSQSFLDSVDFESEYGMTFYRKKFFDTFLKLLEIRTKGDVSRLMEFMEAGKGKQLATAFQKQGLTDMYATMLVSELLNQACLTLGFNPINASDKVDRIMRN